MNPATAATAAALGAAALAACTPARPALERRPTVTVTATPAPPDPDTEALRAWLAAERRVAGRYAAVVRQVPDLRALRANHTARAATIADHLRARGLVPDAEVDVQPARGRPGAVVPALARAERTLAAGYHVVLPRLTDPTLVLLGAQLAAGAWQHAAVLALVRVPR